MAKSFETTVEIKGAIGSSFTAAFNNAASGLVDLKQQAKAVQQEMDRMGKDFRQGKIHQSQYTTETQKLAKELQNLERIQQKQIATQQRWDNTKTHLTNVGNRVKNMATVGAIGGAAVATGVAINSLNTGADFEAQMSKVAAKTEATKAEMEALNKSALALGASSSLSASEVAVAMDELGAKGMDANQIIAAMPGIISAAEASGEDLALVSDVVTSAINSYALGAEEASRVADIMAMSANKTAADVNDLGYAFKYAAPIANTLGIKLEELAASTGILTDKGLAGEQAGTALRMALIRLSSPPKAAQKALDKLNISATKADGKFKSLGEITEDWNKATKNLTDTQKVAYASTIFGTEASTAMLSLFSSGPQKIKEMTTALEESGGAAEKAAKQMKDNYAGAKEQMFGAIESSQIAFVSPILPVIQETFDGIAYLIENNIGTIENSGKAVAAVLEDILMPFSITEKPLMPKITPDMNVSHVNKLMTQYQKDLEKYELFSGMDLGDKVVYMLDTTVNKTETWIAGEGGDAIEKVFTELGTLAGKAWIAGFKTTATGAVSNALDGNFAGAIALGAAANMMTGGLLLKGGVGAGKWALDKAKDLKGLKGKKTPSTPTSTSSSYVGPLQSAKNAEETRKTTAAASKSAKATSALSNLSKYGKVAGKAFLPLSILASAANIATADDKSKAVGSSVGGIGGALGGAALGASIGSVVPVIGTAAGGIIGGIAGGLGGDALGGWVGGKFGSNKASASSPTSNNATSVDLSKLSAEIGKATENATLLTNYVGQAGDMIYGSFYPLEQETNLATKSVGFLVTYAGQASGMVYGSFYSLQQETNLVTKNMGILSSYVGQASGWINSLSNIQTAGQRVITALNNLEERINNVQLPVSAQSRRVSYDS